MSRASRYNWDEEDVEFLQTESEPSPTALRNAFCPTGPGGGVDPHCSPTGGKAHDEFGVEKGEAVLADGRKIRFIPHSAQSKSETMVMVDPKKLDTAWDPIDRINEQGKGPTAIEGKRERVTAFVATGKPVEAIHALLNEDGSLRVHDGRHRFSTLRDLGASAIGVTVPKEDVKEMIRRFGLPKDQERLAAQEKARIAREDATLEAARPKKKAGLLRRLFGRNLAADSKSLHRDTDLRESVRLMAGNYRHDQPRDPRGRFAHTGGPGPSPPAGAALHLPPPVVLTKAQRLALTKEEDQQWRKTWKERAAVKTLLKVETDAHAKGQMERRVDELTRELQKIRDAGKQRSEGTAVEKGGKGLDHEAEAQKMVTALEKLAGPGLRREDLIHLQSLRREMKHLSKEDFDAVIQHARRTGQISLAGAEGRSGLREADKKAAVYEKDPVTGLDSMLLYASLRGGVKGVGTGGVAAKFSLTRQELRDRLQGAAPGWEKTGSFKGRDEMLRVMGEHGREVGDVTRHGMTNAEKMYEVEIEGIKFQWPSNHIDAQRNAARSLADLVSGASGTVPEKLWNTTQTVVFSTQRNKDDDHWAQEYNEPGFKSAASGGDGHVVVYNTDKQGMTYDTFTHEFGHNLAFKEWGNTSPPAHTDYGQAQKREKPVSPYGEKSPAEDFAEAARLYSSRSERGAFIILFPLKYKAVHALLGKPSKPVS